MGDDEKRGKGTQQWVEVQIYKLLRAIRRLSKDGAAREDGVRFADLFEAFSKECDVTVGIITRARKRGFIDYDRPGVLFQGRDDDIEIRLLPAGEDHLDSMRRLSKRLVAESREEKPKEEEKAPASAAPKVDEDSYESDDDASPKAKEGDTSAPRKITVSAAQVHNAAVPPVIPAAKAQEQQELQQHTKKKKQPITFSEYDRPKPHGRAGGAARLSSTPGLSRFLTAPSPYRATAGYLDLEEGRAAAAAARAERDRDRAARATLHRGPLRRFSGSRAKPAAPAAAAPSTAEPADAAAPVKSGSLRSSISRSIQRALSRPGDAAAAKAAPVRAQSSPVLGVAALASPDGPPRRPHRAGAMRASARGRHPVMTRARAYEAQLEAMRQRIEEEQRRRPKKKSNDDEAAAPKRRSWRNSKPKAAATAAAAATAPVSAAAHAASESERRVVNDENSDNSSNENDVAEVTRPPVADAAHADSDDDDDDSEDDEPSAQPGAAGEWSERVSNCSEGVADMMSLAGSKIAENAPWRRSLDRRSLDRRP